MVCTMPNTRETITVATLAALQTQGRNAVTPFRVALPDNTFLLCDRILRLMPGKRLVASGSINGKHVLIKLFFAEKSLRAECSGYALLQKTGATSPQQLNTYTVDKGGVCLYEFIDQALPLDSAWQSLNSIEKKQQWLQLLAVLAQCYRAGVYQEDLHLGNFLLSPHGFYAIDPASCRAFSSTFTRNNNLALLLAQMPLQEWSWLAPEIVTAFPDINIAELFTGADTHWQHRKQQYLNKIQRDCSDIADISHANKRILCRRDRLSDGMRRALDNPAALLEKGTVLKSGNSATVIAVMIDDKRYVLKRYRNKDIWRTIRRLWRTTRAVRSWYFSHALTFAGIHTPTPIALVEMRKHGTVIDAWFITEYIAGKDLLSHWQHQVPTDKECSNIQQLFAGLKKSALSHGDMKATNILVEQEKFYLIDFDGAREITHKKSLEKALHHDAARFLRNWDAEKTITLLKQALAL